MNLSDLFIGLAYKELALVDLPHKGSNQHELNVSQQLKDLLGSEARQDPIEWHFFPDEGDPVADSGAVTFYDARAKTAWKTKRSEWRLYYTGEFLQLAEAGDILVLARTRDGQLHGLVFPRDTTWYRASIWVFGLDDPEKKFTLRDQTELSHKELAFARQHILEELGLSFLLPPDASDEELVTETFGSTFPTTAVMSAFARRQSSNDGSDPDTALLAWLTREEELFRALEKSIVETRLKHGFDGVDAFISYSLSVHNRRKSRMGHSLEHHLAALFTYHGILFDTQVPTERRNRPDFLFPGKAAYMDESFPPANLIMLAAKSTCKDRWRQVLTEAERIPIKHLCTLEQGITLHQLAEMREQKVLPVIPKGLQEVYPDELRAGILTLEEFLDKVKMNW